MRSQFILEKSHFLVARPHLCQHHNMKHFFLACLFPMTLTAQTMQLTEQLGKTVLYGDIAFRPMAHMSRGCNPLLQRHRSKPTFVKHLETRRQNWLKLNHPARGPIPIRPGLPIPRHSHFFPPPVRRTATTLDRERRWLEAQKATKLNGYAARPHWSHDGKQIAFLYIEGAGGGGPLMAAPARPASSIPRFIISGSRLLDLATKQVRQVSPADLHIYDFDWSPDGKTFVATAAPGPGDNNWWIAQIYTIDIAKGSATSIYKPSLQVAVPRWSPDGKSIAFIEGLMSDEGFHGGDLFTISADRPRR